MSRRRILGIVQNTVEDVVEGEKEDVQKKEVELSTSYLALKEELDPLKKKETELKNDIKDLFLANNHEEAVVGDMRVYMTTSVKTEFNELRAIEILRNNLPKPLFDKVVKKKEYIDEDALEDIIFQRQFDAKKLAPATEEKAPSYAIRTGKVKK